MKKENTILVLGAGVGGIVTANRLRKLLPKNDRIIIFDREKDHLFAPSLLWLMIGDRTPEKISKPISRLEKKGIQVVLGEISKIDPENKTVTIKDKTYSGDSMVITLGADYNEASIAGLGESGFNLYSLSGSIGIRDQWKSFKGGRIVIL